MTPRRLVLYPLAAALFQTAVGAALDDRGFWALQMGWQLFAAVGCFAAAAAFRPRDLLWKAWVLSGSSFVLPLLYRLATGPDEGWWLARAPGFEAIQIAYALGINAFSAAGALLFAVSFLAAGLMFSLPGARRIGWMAAPVVLALAIGVPTLRVEVRDALGAGATSDALFGAISTAGDMLCFALVGALARIAIEFRGGALQLPWALLAVSNLGWLTYDAATAAARVGGVRGRVLAIEAVYCVSCVAAGSAGFAHRRALALGTAESPAPRGA